MSKRYPQGQPVYIPLQITDNTVTPPVPVDGGALLLTLTKPDGTISTYTPTHDGSAGSGLYHQTIPTTDLTQLGDYRWKLVVTGAGAGVGYGSFEVFDPFEATLINLADARTQLQIDPDDRTDDDLIQEWVAGITAVVEQYKHEIIVPRTVTEELPLDFGRRLFRVYSAPVISLISVVSWDGSMTWDVSNMRASSSGLVRVMAGPRVGGLIDVTVRAGYTIIPENYQQGALVILQHIWETRRGQGSIPTGVIGQEDINRTIPFDFPHKAKEWLGPPRPVVA